MDQRQLRSCVCMGTKPGRNSMHQLNYSGLSSGVGGIMWISKCLSYVRKDVINEY